MRRSLLFGTLLVSWLCLALLAAAPVMAATLVLAQISDRPKKDFRQLRPMAEHIVPALAPFGFDRAEVQVFPDLPELEAAIRAGQVHWISETPLTAARLYQQDLVVPLARKWKRQQYAYQSLIYVPASSPIQQLTDLRGRVIAFEHANSFSSYFLPLAALRHAGLTLTALARPTDPVPPDRVGYVFSRNERNNLLWVAKGLVAAGALNDGDWHTPGRLPAPLLAEMRVIHRSPAYPRAFELATHNLAPPARAALQQALLALDPARDRDRAVLHRYEHSSRITPLESGDLALLEQLEVEDLP